MLIGQYGLPARLVQGSKDLETLSIILLPSPVRGLAHGMPVEEAQAGASASMRRASLCLTKYAMVSSAFTDPVLIMPWTWLFSMNTCPAVKERFWQFAS